MATFKDNVHKANKSGESAINWEYYGLMKNYFGKKDSVAPMKNTLVQSSLSNYKIDGNKPHEFIRPQFTNDSEVSKLWWGTFQISEKKSFQEVLLEEIKEDRRSRDSFQNKLENFMEKSIEIETAKLERNK